MKFYIILGLLFAVVSGEKKINLDDIERDNLRAESKTKSATEAPSEAKYSVTEATASRYNTPNSLSAAYDVPQDASLEQYRQPGKYDITEVIYPQKNTGVYEHSAQQLQYYSQPQKSTPVYEQPHIVHQPEVLVGNHGQAIQQKSVTDKYVKSNERGTVYVDIPMSQLLAYYPNLQVNSIAEDPKLHQQLTPSAAQQISIPVYTPLLNQNLVTPVKANYQAPTTYASQYVQPIYSAKVTKTHTSDPVALKKPVSSSVLTSPVYVQPEQSYAQPKKLVYSQTYLPPTEAQYVQQVVYSQPSGVYAHASPAYPDLYTNAAPAYIQDNSIHGQSNFYAGQPQQYYLSPQSVPQELTNFYIPASHDASQNYVKVPEEPRSHFVPPQLPAQTFKTPLTHLSPISVGHHESLLSQNHGRSREPASLLDSYVPSYLIAAQDYARYQERPIKLEGGFLPSKVNFVHSHKKRKIE